MIGPCSIVEFTRQEIHVLASHGGEFD